GDGLLPGAAAEGHRTAQPAGQWKQVVAGLRPARWSEATMFTREEVLGGLSGRRAHVLLFLIESRTARLAARSWEFASLDLAPELGVWNPVLGEDRASAGDEEESLLAPFGRRRARLPRPTIREIERYAREWASLVPEDPRARAAVARLLGEKYRFTRATVPDIRAALGLDSAAVQSAYEGLYREPLEEV